MSKTLILCTIFTLTIAGGGPFLSQPNIGFEGSPKDTPPLGGGPNEFGGTQNGPPPGFGGGGPFPFPGFQPPSFSAPGEFNFSRIAVYFLCFRYFS